MANILLGISGSIAAYRAADLARDLMRAGHTVRTCLTDSAAEFVTPILFESLTGEPCLTSVFEEPERGRFAHIDWARWADVIVVAPATANTLSRLAWGQSDDMLTTVTIASEAPLVVAPAMNPFMWSSETNQAALARLRERATVVEPEEGIVACGEEGQGKLADNASILAAVAELLARRGRWTGRHVLITSGPTQEPIDLARFLTNRSSGKMGSALARAALELGAQVSVVAGPQTAPIPAQAQIFRVRTAEEMLAAALALAPTADLILGAAAVADYRPAHPSSTKIRRQDASLMLELVPNPDIVAALALAAPRARVVAFAAEPSLDDTIAREKMARKGVAAIAMNDVSQPDQGFEAGTNRLRLLRADGRSSESPFDTKLRVARWLLDELG